jgi:hypothetical protein
MDKTITVVLTLKTSIPASVLVDEREWKKLLGEKAEVVAVDAFDTLDPPRPKFLSEQIREKKS